MKNVTYSVPEWPRRHCAVNIRKPPVALGLVMRKNEHILYTSFFNEAFCAT